MPSLSGDADWLRAFEGQVLPALESFRPQFVLVSAGFDAHARDPLSSTRLSEDGFRQMTAGALELAGRCCEGRLVSLLEGGYDLQALASCVETHMDELHRAGG
jgi:acetoin utilization deacetylase AcuC-like enzyme